MTITDAVITRIRELSYEHDITITRWCMRAGVLPSTVYGILKKKIRLSPRSYFKVIVRGNRNYIV